MIAAIKQALKDYGEYTYYDKGPDEVIGMRPWMQRLFALPIPEVVTALEEVLAWEHGEPFVRDIVVDWDTQESFDALLDASPVLAELY